MKNVTYINAGAGSGKTTTLTKILAEKLLEKETNGNFKIAPSQVILTTFTEMAAAEFRQRARQKLYESGQTDIAIQMDAATIGTIHSVAFSFIKKYWYLIGVSPDMKVMSEEDLQVYISQSLGDYVDQPDLDVFRQYCDFFYLRGSDNISLNYNFWINELLNIINKINTYKVDLESSKTYSTALIARIFHAGQATLNKKRLKDVTDSLNSHKTEYATAPLRKAESLIKGLGSSTPTYATLADLYNELTKAETLGKGNRDAIKADMKNGDFDELIQELENFLLSSESPDESSAGEMIKKMVETIFDIASRWKEGFVEFKKRRHIIDYNDMEQHFLNLLRNDKVRKEFEGNYKLLMVDEFQDCSPIQLEIFQLLSDMMESSYWVGDPKQSIYGFRGTDVSLVNELVGLFRNSAFRQKNNLTILSLEKSYRTRPSLVDMTTNCFIRAYNGVMTPDDVRLTSERPEFGNEEQQELALSHWNCRKAPNAILYDKVSDRIAKLKNSRLQVVDKDTKIIRDIKYGDIAILCRKNSECANYAKSLAKRHIPVAYVNDDISQQIEVNLVITILKLMVDPTNKHVIADLLRLLNDQETTNILNSRLDYCYQQQKKLIEKQKENEEKGITEDIQLPDEWMKDSPLIEKLIKFVKAGQHLSVSDLVESIIYGLALPDIVAKWGNKDIRQQNLSSVCALAKQYDNHCLQMGIGASVGGFIIYLSYTKLEPKIDNSADAVKVLTYHKAKGLEWNYVILDSLDDDSMEDKSFVKQNFWGVREIRKKSDQTLCNEYQIQYLPRITSSGNTGILTPILATCMKEDSWKVLKNREKNELCDLLYVGVTRARDYLTTLSFQTNQKKLPELSWIKNTGISSGNLENNATALWNYDSLKPVYEDIANIPSAIPSDEEVYTCYQYPENPEIIRDPKYLSPSKLPQIEFAKENIEILDNLKCRIENYDTDDTNQAAAGTCIHNIFAVYDPTLSHEENVDKATDIRNGNNMYGIISEPEEVINSIEHLYAWLEQTYGKASSVKHEVPFIQPLPGQIVHGEIDLLWYLNENECVLIDFKNFPGDRATITNPDPKNENYAGKYASQLKAYRDVLHASGITVRDALIYYSVMGCVVRLNL